MTSAQIINSLLAEVCGPPMEKELDPNRLASTITTECLLTSDSWF